MNPERKLMLLLVDGSDQSMDMIDYVAHAVDLDRAEIVLFHVLDKVPEIFWDREKDPLASKHLEYIEKWTAHKEGKLREFMERARKAFTGAGAPESAVTITIHPRREGIARDILAESKFGYGAVALGRKGLGALDDAMLGHVAAKCLANLSEVPMCLVGGRPKPGKILVALDNSLGAIRVVNFVAGMLCGSSDPAVTLAHVVRTPKEDDGTIIGEGLLKQLMTEGEKAIEPVFEEARKALNAAGVMSDRIGVKVISGAGSRAMALINEAKQGEYGTLVVGRRGMSDVEDFPMGRVAGKLAQVARGMALWIVS